MEIDMQEQEIDALTDYDLDSAIAEIMEPHPETRAAFGTRSDRGWWIAGTGAWLPGRRMADYAGDNLLSILDRLSEMGLHANIEDFGRQHGERRFFIAGGGGESMRVAYAPTLPIAAARLLLRVCAIESRSPQLDAKPAPAVL